MNTEVKRSTPPDFFKTVLLLLTMARRRSVGRAQRQTALLQHRTGRKDATDRFRRFATIAEFLFVLVIHSFAAWMIHSAVEAGQRLEAQHQGKIVVRESFLSALQKVELSTPGQSRQHEQAVLEGLYSSEARHLTREIGKTDEQNEKYLREAVRTHKSIDFVNEAAAKPGLLALAQTGSLPAMLGSLTLIWWLMMLVFQGEGLELDLQRRRHPMWEWLSSHPVPQGAIFLAEMLSPLAANAVYSIAPLFWGFLFGSIYGVQIGIVAVLLIGIPTTVATSCLGKGLEIGVTLRISLRSRSAVIGLMSWFGYASMMSLVLGPTVIPKIVGNIEDILRPISQLLPWPWLGILVGLQPNGSFSFYSGMVACWSLSAVLAVCGVAFSIWAASRGLVSASSIAGVKPKKVTKAASFGRDPLYKKEMLWFVRDRGALVQVLLIPLTITAIQVFHLRGVVNGAHGAWNYLSGVAIVFGTYFLWILCPKSLASEGSALWLALTWPRGMENLLKAKAKLWFVIASGIVALILIYAMLRFPENAWKIALVGVGWVAFGYSMAAKAVTLVTVPSSAGEPEPVSKARKFGASAGMLTFGFGILFQQWHLALMGIVYSWMTAAAMWQNFRARIPYLYDPWSEKLPQAPTLVHAMIAISALVEVGVVVVAALVTIVGIENIAVVQPLAYGVCAGGVALISQRQLTSKGANSNSILCWGEPLALQPSWVISITLSILSGLSLGIFGHAYMGLLTQIPAIAEMVRSSQEQMANFSGLRISYTVIAIAIAPFAEEYVFRGLLYRALDREWGGWKAIIGSAAFFAVYHPPMAWLPVGLLGVAAALIFKKTGRLLPAVLLHMVYNAVVLYGS